MSERKTLGVLGGMGPLATWVFTHRLTEHTAASRDQDHLDILVYSHAALPDRTECILSGSTSKLVNMLTRDAMMLEKNGAGVIAIPCNTAHAFYDRIQAVVEIPVIHMIRETIASLQGVQTIGVLATESTVAADLYGSEAAAAGIRVMYPPREVQLKVSDIIERIKRGEHMDMWALRGVSQELRERGCDRILLACTELSCVTGSNPFASVFVDPMDILVQKSIELCGGRYR